MDFGIDPIVAMADADGEDATEEIEILVAIGIPDKLVFGAVSYTHLLEGTGSEENEFGGVAPGADAADGGDGELDLGIGGDLLDHVEGDGFDGGTAIAAMGGFAADIGARGESVEIDTGN